MQQIMIHSLLLIGTLKIHQIVLTLTAASILQLTIKVISSLALPEMVNVSFLSAVSFDAICPRNVDDTDGVNELLAMVILVWVKAVPTPATSREIELID